MQTNRGSAAVVLLVALVVVLAAVLVYFAFLKKPGEVAVSPTPTATPRGGGALNPSESSKFKVLFPVGGESWLIRKSYTIEWQGPSHYNNVTIAIYKPGMNAMIIGDEVPNTGSYIWTVPTDMPQANNYIIQIYPAGARELIGTSKPFSITH